MNRREAIALLSALPAVSRVERLDVTPSTVVCLLTNARLTAEQREVLRQQLAAVLPATPVLVLDSGMQLRTVERGAAAVDPERPRGRS